MCRSTLVSVRQDCVLLRVAACSGLNTQNFTQNWGVVYIYGDIRSFVYFQHPAVRRPAPNELEFEIGQNNYKLLIFDTFYAYIFWTTTPNDMYILPIERAHVKAYSTTLKYRIMSKQSSCKIGSNKYNKFSKFPCNYFKIIFKIITINFYAM